MELVLGFAELAGAAVLLTAAITGGKLSDVLSGKAYADWKKQQASGSAPGASNVTGGSTITAMPSAVGAGAAQPLQYGTALTGSNATAWAKSILQTLGAPLTSANLGSLVTWFGREGGGGSNNPLNTTLSAPGAQGAINSAGVQNYNSPANGIAATVQTLKSGYPAIVSALTAGSGLGSGNPAVASELYTWSGGGYSSL